MGREFELKYKAEAGQQEAIREAFPGGETLRMETTYYDLPGGLLSSFRWTLRRRMENDRSVCTLKTPAPDGSKAEWEVDCDDIFAALPLLVQAGAPAELPSLTKDPLTGDTLVPICGARFTRIAIPVEYGSSRLELALDRGMLLGGGKELPLCEVEVELKQGSDDDAIGFSLLLAARYGLTPEKKSKFKRARDLAAEK